MKRKLFRCLVLVVSLCIFGGCTSDENDVDYIPVQLEEDGLWSMMGTNGDIVFEDEFEESPSVAINGVFRVKDNGGYTLYQIGSNSKIIPNASDLAGAGFISNGLIPISKKGERIELINNSGKSKLTLDTIDGKEIVACSPMFSEGNLIVFTSDSKYGSIGKDGNIIIKPIYSAISGFKDGICLARIEDESGQVTNRLLDTNGNIVFESNKDYTFYDTSMMSHNRMTVRKDGVLGYLTKEGEFTKLPSNIGWYFHISDDYFGFINNDKSDPKYGIIDSRGKILTRAKYKDFGYLGDELCAVSTGNEKYKIIDMEDKVIKKIDSKYVYGLNGVFNNGFGYSYGYTCVSNFHMIKHEDGVWQLCNPRGEKIGKHDFYTFGDLEAPSFVISDYYMFTQSIRTMVHVVNTEIKDPSLGNDLLKYEYFLKDLNAKNYLHSNWVYFPLSNDQPENYNINIGLVCDNKISSRLSNWWGSPGYDECYWNYFSTNLNELQIELDAEFPIFDKAKQNLIYQMQKIGFTTSDNQEAYAVLKCKDIIAIITCPSSLDKVRIDLMFEDRFKSKTLSEYQRDYDQAIQKGENSSSYKNQKFDPNDVYMVEEAVEVVVDSVAY